MYAVIKAGGKQHRVAVGDTLEIELVHGGDETISFTPLLVVDDEGKTHVGKELGKSLVKAKLVGQQKGDKVKIFKYRPKSGYARRQGHRQMYTVIEILDISLGSARAARGSSAKAEAAAEKSEEATADS
jgi:large subunit ribosomal protein L21